MPNGRFAPSPTGDLHLGNLRTAVVAWLAARHDGGRFVVRMEDLDRHQASVANEQSQLADLAAIGLEWDPPVLRQSDRFDRYEAAIADLTARGLTYPCYCTRREIREAASAPHHRALPEGAYPGTCRALSEAERRQREQAGRPPALRLRAEPVSVTVEDALLGPVTAVVDDLVLRRNDGVPAYNLAVVVDDAAQGVVQVVRGDDLADSAPRQRYLGGLLGLPEVSYLHVPLVLGPTGQRLAKRDGAVTLRTLAEAGVGAAAVTRWLLASLGSWAHGAEVPADLLGAYRPSLLDTSPVLVTPDGGDPPEFLRRGGGSAPTA